jgi:hypothetical protein
LHSNGGLAPSSISLDNGIVTFSPGLNDENGVLLLALKINLPSWPTALDATGFEYVFFNVQVNGCVAGIDTSNV